ncbi:hypothetical protein C2845_PM07G39900 [Panicum miliaceum]|uniref:DUF1618 domain-containing protein n=1 Tax=Panicum miliaceum TaxID=4540 RepID=A0A3L6SJE4_PANMI|nr:hypothetical protein C2845_PM07G39900 [Panicum miliaceum]
MPPSPGPGQRWVVLRRMACTDPGLPQGTGFCLAIGSRTPGVTELFVSSLVDGGSGALVRNPFVLAADPSGLLLLSGSDDDNSARTPYFLWDAVSNTVRQLPHLPDYGDTGTAGLIVSHNDDYMVAELAVSNAGAILHCFSSQTGGEWIRKTLGAPMVRSQWRTDHVLSYDGKIWWIDLSQGLLSCDPRLPADISQGLHFVPFPNLRRTNTLLRNRSTQRRDPRTQRSIHLSDGKLRYVVITTRARVPKIKLWTLADPESDGEWTLDYEVSFEELWADRNYERTGLPNTVPVFALVHPDDPHVVYFAQEERLFGFNLRMKTVTECAANDIGIKEASSAILLAWKLPPLLQISPGPSPATSSFDRLVGSFSDAFNRALMDMEFHQFARTSISYLNEDVTKEDKVDGQQKQYAHINFSAHAGSKRVLVFAELAKTVEGNDPWNLNTCKKLNKGSHGNILSYVPTNCFNFLVV